MSIHLRVKRAYLSCAETDHQVSDERIFGLATAMGDHDAPAGLLRHLASLDGLRHGADLVYLQQQTVAGFLVDGVLYALGVGHQQIVSGNTIDKSEELAPNIFSSSKIYSYSDLTH